jgi:hypothetical protein
MHSQSYSAIDIKPKPLHHSQAMYQRLKEKLVVLDSLTLQVLSSATILAFLNTKFLKALLSEEKG